LREQAGTAHFTDTHKPVLVWFFPINRDKLNKECLFDVCF